uniref:Uncharacterized protein n=1 Tax=virus sp. ctML55 TaxID=2827627 RepID=A0A8S5RJ06_9VIRU|nr:MAG TPA: hypothetical protein [virus sp. ctML55]DAV59967.1 MAG TPA: hypothetical protein [Caudoviricetes sp.]DAW91981.1 MAG TPA: hypothetical protein [Bacteriophage sp.]
MPDPFLKIGHPNVTIFVILDIFNIMYYLLICILQRILIYLKSIK